MNLNKLDMNKYIFDAIKEFPFYEWLYSDLDFNDIEYDNLPIMRKEDLIKYKLEKDKEFFQNNSNTEYNKFLSTTGTTGISLKFPYDENDGISVVFFDTVLKFLEKRKIHLETVALLDSFPYFINDLLYGISIKISYNPVIIEKSDLINFESFIKRNSIDTIMDITLEISKIIIKNKIDSSRSGLKNIFIMAIEPGIYSSLRRLGYNIISIFASCEFSGFGFNLNEEKSKYIYIGNPIIIDLENSKKEETLVLTGQSGAFPLIKYATDDKVLLEEDTENIYFNYYGRYSTVGIPDNNQANFNYNVAIDEFIKSEYFMKSKFVLVAYKILIDGFEKNIISTFIYSNELFNDSNEIQKLIMISGMGEYVESYKKFFPVFYVEESELPNIGRSKYFLNLIDINDSLDSRESSNYINLIEKIEKRFKIV